MEGRCLLLLSLLLTTNWALSISLQEDSLKRCLSTARPTLYDPEELCSEFARWQQEHKSHTLRLDVSYVQQLKTFEASLHEVRTQQRTNPSAVFKLNQFAVWPRNILLKPQTLPRFASPHTPPPRIDLDLHLLPPKSYKNVTTPIKNQGNCGSCWAHAAVEQIESYLALAGKPLAPLSVQQITSCDLSNGATNCNGGNIPEALRYAAKSGMMSEAEYPYKSGSLTCGFFGVMGSDAFCVQGSDRCLSVPNHCPAPEGRRHKRVTPGISNGCVNGQCSADYFGCCLTQFDAQKEQGTTEQTDSTESMNGTIVNSNNKGWTGKDNTGKMCLYDKAKATQVIDGASSVPPGADHMLYHLATKGPLGVSIQANSLIFYHSGIVTNCDHFGHHPVGIDHAVQLIGYGGTGDDEYWLLRNSWGTLWGEHGFFRIKRNMNLCNLENYTSSWFPALS